MAAHGLELGALDFVSGLTYDGGFTLSVLGDGASFGASQAVVREIVSMLADGNHVKYDRAGNRVASFDVLIAGPDGPALAAGERALRRELYRPNLLTWTPPAFLSEPTVFEVVTSEMTPLFDDIDEIRDRRKFRVTLTCSPFARSKDPVTVAALTVGAVPATTTLSNCSTTTGWSTSTPGVVGSTAGYVYSTESAASSGEAQHYLFFAATADPALPYPVIEWQTTFPLVFGAGPTCVSVPLIETTALGDGWTRSTYNSTGFAGASFAFGAFVRGSGGQFRIRNFDRTNIPPGQTPRQKTRVIEVGGTERTPGSIHVQTASGTGSLGQAIVHTCPEDGSGYSPPLQRWRTVGQTRTTDATAFSGTYESINVTSWVAEVPTSALPMGGYSLVARLRAQTAATVLISYSTSTIFPDGVTQQGFTLGQKSHVFAVGNEWDIVPLAVLSLPSVRTESGKVQIALQVEAASPVVTLDECWLFREEGDCALSIVETARPHLWLDSPDTNSPVPTVWVGNGTTTKVHPGEGLVAQGNHILSADGTAVFTAALSDNPLTEATAYPRNHSNM